MNPSQSRGLLSPLLAPRLAPWLAPLVAMSLLVSCAPVLHSRAPVADREAMVTNVATQLKEVIDRAVVDGAFPGAVAIVGDAQGILASYSAGQLDSSDAVTPDLETIWDLASLTKVLVTTTAVMQLTYEQRMALDSPVVRYLPEWQAPGAEAVTVRHLLAHASGLRAGRPLYREAEQADSAIRLILTTHPDTAPGARYIYSDLGFLLLGMAVERVAGLPLDAFARARIFEPLGMHDTGYRPAATLLARIAPTELDPWRQRKVRGEVHDENALRLGGVAGHAGLFSTGRDLARFAQAMLRGGELDGVQLAHADALAGFTALQDSSLSHRALGWEKPNGTNSAGRGLSPAAFGHTGFTGTSLWIDPAQDLFIILLTNRVNPTRENRRISGVRVDLADGIISARRAAGFQTFLEGGSGRR